MSTTYVSNKPPFKVGQVWRAQNGVLREVRYVDRDGHAIATDNCYINRACDDYIGEVPSHPSPKIGDKYLNKNGLIEEYTVIAAAGEAGAFGDGVVLQRLNAVSLARLASDFKKVR
jgi:hypothetical protein